MAFPGEDGVDASFHTKEWLDARFSAAAVKRETFEEYRERKDREDAVEQAEADKLADAEGAVNAGADCIMVMSTTVNTRRFHWPQRRVVCAAKYREQMAKERKRRFASVDEAGIQKKESKHKSKSKKDKKDKKHKSSKHKSRHRSRERSPT